MPTQLRCLPDLAAHYTALIAGARTSVATAILLRELDARHAWWQWTVHSGTQFGSSWSVDQLTCMRLLSSFFPVKYADVRDDRTANQPQNLAGLSGTGPCN